MSEKECEICGNNIIETNRKIVEGWNDEKKKLHFWYWCGVTNFGEEKDISPYSTEIIDKFDKRCGIK